MIREFCSDQEKEELDRLVRLNFSKENVNRKIKLGLSGILNSISFSKAEKYYQLVKANPDSSDNDLIKRLVSESDFSNLVTNEINERSKIYQAFMNKDVSVSELLGIYSETLYGYQNDPKVLKEMTSKAKVILDVQNDIKNKDLSPHTKSILEGELMEYHLPNSIISLADYLNTPAKDLVAELEQELPKTINSNFWKSS